MPESPETPDRSSLQSGLKSHKVLVLDSNYMPYGYPVRVMDAETLATLLPSLLPPAPKTPQEQERDARRARLRQKLAERHALPEDEPPPLRAEVVETSPFVILRGDRAPFPLPSVIRMLHPVENLHNQITGLPVPFTWDNLYIRDQGICQYTDEPVSWKNADDRKRATFDHVVPRRHKGETTWLNAVMASAWANNARKGDKTPFQADFWLWQDPWIPEVADMHYLSVQSWLENPEVQESWIPYLEKVKPTPAIQRMWNARNPEIRKDYFDRRNYYASAA